MWATNKELNYCTRLRLVLFDYWRYASIEL
jgi:hypothetical protein